MARGRGVIEELPSGALRAKVYAGIDPITKRRYYLTETIPTGHPHQQQEAEKTRQALVAKVEEKRHPRGRASVGYVLDRYMDGRDVEETTLDRERDIVRLHILPLLGEQPAARIDEEIADSLLAELRRCRVHCDKSRELIDHRTTRPHECDQRCRPHQCEGLGRWSVRKAYWICHAAWDKAKRLRWVDDNPWGQLEPPHPPPSRPRPPAPAHAAKIVEESWKVPEWGMLVWLAMTTGMRRGEIPALRWENIDLDRNVIHFDRAIVVVRGTLHEKDTKDHQDRRIVLDDITVKLLTAYREHCAAKLVSLGCSLDDRSYLFSDTPDHSQPIRPSEITRRYRRLVDRLGIKTSFHKLRHFAATELLSAGVDVRTVAGRLGHGGGGTTTLKTYAAFVAEADQRAARGMLDWMPKPPVELDAPTPLQTVQSTEPREPYNRIAADLRGAIRCGALPPSSTLPTVTELAKRYQVAASTAHRAIASLAQEGLIEVSRGQRAVVVDASTR